MSTNSNKSAPAQGKSGTHLKCADVTPDLVALHAGELSPIRAEVVRKHLSDCFACREMAFELRIAERSFGKIPDIEPPANLVERAMDKVREESAGGGPAVQGEQKHRSFLFRPITSPVARVAIAAGFMLMAIAFNVPSIADALGRAGGKIIGPQVAERIDEATSNVLMKLFM